MATVSMSAAQRPPATAPIDGRVYLTPTCGCCGKWVEHMRNAVYTVHVTEMEDAFNDFLFSFFNCSLLGAFADDGFNLFFCYLVAKYLHFAGNI